MGSSPREQAAAGQLDYLRKLAPEISKPTFDLKGVLGQVMGQLDRSGALITSTLGQQAGAQLAGGGVPTGQPRIESYITALAPTFGKFAEQKALNISDLSKFAATNEVAIRQLLAMITGQEMGAIGGMKGSTGLGDILGVLNTLANVAKGAAPLFA